MAARKATKPEELAARAVDEQLARYRAMRDFDRTAEPSGGGAEAPLADALAFCVQKHAATRLHYDFRLAWRGVLKSWAVAKGPSYVVRDKRLAVQVEDHPIEYGGFEGTIPKGQYGGGTVLLWDQGVWEPQAGHTDIDEGLRTGSLKFVLRGEKLHGKWALIRMGGKAAQEAKPNWLLIKEHDEYERPADAPAVADAEPESVITGRTIDQIAAAADHVWESKPAATKQSALTNATAPSPKLSTAEVSREIKAALGDAPEEAMPAFLAPQLAAAAHQPPTGADWLQEIKLDGYRVQLHILNSASGATATIYTRTGLDWTARMPALAEAARRLPVQSAILDGEAVVLDAQGNTSFSALQAAFEQSASNRMTCFLFDLLHLNGRNLRAWPLRERKALLAQLLAWNRSDALRFCEHIEGADGAAVLAQACSLGAEGIIAKLATSAYTGGRADSWRKLKCVRRQELIICGFTMPKDRGAGLGSLLLGYYAEGKLIHCGRCGTGFTQASARALRTRLEALRTEKQPYLAKLTGPARKDAMWVRPELVCEVEFANWTEDGQVRHAAFEGLREDKPAEQVVREDSAAARKTERGRRGLSTSRNTLAGGAVTTEQNEPQGVRSAQDHAVEEGTQEVSKAATVARESFTDFVAQKATGLVTNLKLTHPDKILDPATGVTKRRLAAYYEAVAEVMLPHIAGRPSSLVRCPEGSAKPCFFQKHAGAGLPKALGSVDVPDKKTGKPEAYLTVDTAEALVSLAQLGVLEVHPWGSRAEALEVPDRLIFDLDPDEALPWPTLVASARAIRAFLRELQLESFVKTTGGKGLHLVVPISSEPPSAALEEPPVAWPQIKLFCRGIAAAIESTDPKLYLIKMTKAARTGRIFIDYLRNERGATAVAPWSPRARGGMRVAVPLEWSELDTGPFSFSVANLDTWRDRLTRDPWAGLAESRQTLRPNVLAAVLDSTEKMKD